MELILDVAFGAMTLGLLLLILNFTINATRGMTQAGFASWLMFAESLIVIAVAVCGVMVLVMTLRRWVRKMVDAGPP